MKKALALLVAVAALSGCGGGGSSSADVIDAWVATTVNALRSRDMTTLGNQISNNYLDDCVTKTEVLAFYGTIFGYNGTVAVDQINITAKFIGDNVASCTGSYRIRVTGEGGTQTFLIPPDTFYFIKEGNTWREVGNQQCN